MKVGFEKILTALILLTFSFFTACGNQSVIPDPFDPGDYTDNELSFSKESAPYDTAAKVENDQLTYSNWMSEDDAIMYIEFADMLILGAFGPRLSGGLSFGFPTLLSDQISLSGGSNLIYLTAAVGADTIKIYINGEQAATSDIQFDYDHGGDTLTINGIAYNTSDFEMMFGSSDAVFFKNMITDEYAQALYYYEQAKQSLVLKYDFENLGYKSVIDTVNYNNAAMIGNPSIVKGLNNKSLLLNGKDDRLKIKNDSVLSFDSEFTYSSWINYPEGITDAMMLIDKGTSKDNYSILLSDGEVLFSFYDSATKSDRTVNSVGMDIQPDTWTHVGIIVNTAGVSFYKNGKLVDKFDSTIDLTTNTNSINIAKNMKSSDCYNYY